MHTSLQICTNTCLIAYLLKKHLLGWGFWWNNTENLYTVHDHLYEASVLGDKSTTAVF